MNPSPNSSKDSWWNISGISTNLSYAKNIISPEKLNESIWTHDSQLNGQKLRFPEKVVDSRSAVDIFLENRPRAGMDTIMGDAPIENPQVYEMSVDEDGDILMADLDELELTRCVTDILSNERMETAKKSPPEVAEIQMSRSAAEFKPNYVLVVDTCFIISHLQLVNDLVKLSKQWSIVVMIPWATIIELDGLKNSKAVVKPENNDLTLSKGKPLGVATLARKANRWIFETLSAGEPGIWGQKREDHKDHNLDLKGDAAILDCCRLVKENWGYNTALLSNDTNLCAKALIYEIRAVCYKGISLTANGILSCLISEDPAAPPGVTMALERIDDKKNTTSKQATASKVSENTGLSGSRYATRSQNEIKPLSGPRINNSGDIGIVVLTRSSWSPPDNVVLRMDPGFQSEVSAYLKRMERDLLLEVPDLLFRHTVTKLGELFSTAYLGVDPRGTIKSVDDIIVYLQSRWMTITTEIFRYKRREHFDALRASGDKWNLWLQRYSGTALTSIDLSLWTEAWSYIWLELVVHENKNPCLDSINRCLNEWKEELKNLLISNKRF